MAALTEDEKVMVMQFMVLLATQNNVSVNYIKDVVRDAAQAVEDLLVSAASTISTTINTATAPYGITLTADQKRWLVSKVFELKFVRDGI